MYNIIDQLLYKVDSGYYNTVFDKFFHHETTVGFERSIFAQEDMEEDEFCGEKIWIIGLFVKGLKTFIKRYAKELWYELHRFYLGSCYFRNSNYDCVFEKIFAIASNSFVHDVVNHKLKFVNHEDL